MSEMYSKKSLNKFKIFKYINLTTGVFNW